MDAQEETIARHEYAGDPGFLTPSQVQGLAAPSGFSPEALFGMDRYFTVNFCGVAPRRQTMILKPCPPGLTEDGGTLPVQESSQGHRRRTSHAAPRPTPRRRRGAHRGYHRRDRSARSQAGEDGVGTAVAEIEAIGVGAA